MNENNPMPLKQQNNRPVKRKRIRRKKGQTVIAVILLLLLIPAIFAFWVAASIYSEYSRTDSSDETVTVFIPKGATENEIAKILKDKGVINYEISFKLKMKNSPHRGKLNYGKYVLKKVMNLDQIVSELIKVSDFTQSVTLTVPEGFSAEKIAERCEQLKIATADEFLRELKEGKFDYDFLDEIPVNKDVKYKLEGYLFPSTHAFAADATAHDVIDKLLGEFEKQYKEVKDMKPADMTLNEVIIRASMIEREAKLDSERPTISGVIQNRLNKDMPLQIDACVVYAISGGLYNVDRVLYEDLKVDSLYNTYKYKGLPVGAICNPGIESIKAAMQPEEHNYLYYKTDTVKNDGSHIFNQTYDEHLKS
ncbi:MAG: endolytic transglycosylase MltG [Clostridia bacterium]|nr:endolytic transglycosylase MltG [Clostridia bacterium]